MVTRCAPICLPVPKYATSVSFQRFWRRRRTARAYKTRPGDHWWASFGLGMARARRAALSMRNLWDVVFIVAIAICLSLILLGLLLHWYEREEATARWVESQAGAQPLVIELEPDEEGLDSKAKRRKLPPSSKLMANRYKSPREIQQIPQPRLTTPAPAYTEQRPCDIESVLGSAPKWPKATVSCVWHDVKTVVFNRIPKCGSGSVTIFIASAQARNRFQLCRSTLYTHRRLRPMEAKSYAKNPFVASRCRNQINMSTPAVLNRHIFYFNFQSVPSAVSSVVHINMIREPVSRCVSRFYYERDARGVVATTLTIDECLRSHQCRFAEWKAKESVSDGHDGEASSRWAQLREECASNYLSRWFCGHDPEVCNAKHAAIGWRVLRNRTEQECGRLDRKGASGAKRLLETAAINVATGHPVVGLVSRMRDSLRLLGRTLPGYFGGVDKEYFSVCNKCNPNRSQFTHPPPNAQHTALLSTINALDVALYAHAERIFDSRLTSCGLV